MTGVSYSCVVDASTAVQLVFPEPLSAQAAALFALLGAGVSVFHVPDLFFAECANICWKKVQRNACTEAEALAGLSNILAFPLTSTSCQSLATDAIRIALAEKITAYDACYFTLAQRMSVPFITADQKLVQKLGASGLVVWLGAWVAPAATP